VKKIDADGTLRAEGEFAGSVLNGKGKQKSWEGSLEEGEFSYGKLNGQGKRTRKSGVIEIGEFKEGQLYNGIEIDAETKYIVTNGEKARKSGIS
jgi:hypothetical protein